MCDEVGSHSCTNIGVNWRTFSKSSFTTCASSSTQAWAANGLDRTPIAKRQGTPCRLSNAHVASDCTRQRSVSPRSEEHTSELQSLMRISYAVFCLKKKNNK